MSVQYINLDEKIVQTISALGATSLTQESYAAVFEQAIVALESGLNEEGIGALATAGLSNSDLTKIVQGSSILMWDLTKGAPRDTAGISKAMQVMGMKFAVADEFLKKYDSCRTRLNDLKGALAISKRRYKDLEWRLDVELSRRQMSVMSAPKFQIRVDVYDPRGDEVGLSREESFLLESDYANMLHMQKELERALSEANSLHGQRMTGYIK